MVKEVLMSCDFFSHFLHRDGSLETEIERTLANEMMDLGTFVSVRNKFE
jgi:hypothetical protein